MQPTDTHDEFSYHPFIPHVRAELRGGPEGRNQTLRIPHAGGFQDLGNHWKFGARGNRFAIALLRLAQRFLGVELLIGRYEAVHLMRTRSNGRRGQCSCCGGITVEECSPVNTYGELGRDYRTVIEFCEDCHTSLGNKRRALVAKFSASNDRGSRRAAAVAGAECVQTTS